MKINLRNKILTTFFAVLFLVLAACGHFEQESNVDWEDYSRQYGEKYSGLHDFLFYGLGEEAVIARLGMPDVPPLLR